MKGGTHMGEQRRCYLVASWLVERGDSKLGNKWYCEAELIKHTLQTHLLTTVDKTVRQQKKMHHHQHQEHQCWQGN